MTNVDLPALQSIQLGKWALAGKENDESSLLVMHSNNEMI